MALAFTGSPSSQSGAQVGTWKMTDLENAEVVISTSALTLWGLKMTGPSGSETGFVKLYDEADTVVVGTTEPKAVFQHRIVGDTTIMFPQGISFTNGMAVVCVTVGGTSGSTSTTAALNLYLLTS